MIDQKIVEGVDTADNEGLEKHEAEDSPTVGVGKRLNHLMTLELGILDALGIASNPFHKFSLVLFASPFDGRGRIGKKPYDEAFRESVRVITFYEPYIPDAMKDFKAMASVSHCHPFTPVDPFWI